MVVRPSRTVVAWRTRGSAIALGTRSSMPIRSARVSGSSNSRLACRLPDSRRDSVDGEMLARVESSSSVSPRRCRAARSRGPICESVASPVIIHLFLLFMQTRLLYPSVSRTMET